MDAVGNQNGSLTQPEYWPMFMLHNLMHVVSVNTTRRHVNWISLMNEQLIYKAASPNLLRLDRRRPIL